MSLSHAGDSQPVNTSDDLLRVVLWGCSECLLWATSERWNGAWDDELHRRQEDPEYGGDPDNWGEHLGLSDSMVCPRCKHVHRDDDMSYVDEEMMVVRVEREPQ